MTKQDIRPAFCSNFNTICDEEPCAQALVSAPIARDLSRSNTFPEKASQARKLKGVSKCENGTENKSHTSTTV